jgi:ATP-dependent DNA ligase
MPINQLKRREFIKLLGGTAAAGQRAIFTATCCILSGLTASSSHASPLAAKPPSGAGWLHEIKHDGFRMMAQRRGVGGRLLTRNGNDWTERYPSVVAALYALRAPDFGYYPDGYFS